MNLKNMEVRDEDMKVYNIWRCIGRIISILEGCVIIFLINELTQGWWKLFLKCLIDRK